MPNLIKLHTHVGGSYVPIVVNVDRISYMTHDLYSNETNIYIDSLKIIVIEPLNRIEKLIHRIK